MPKRYARRHRSLRYLCSLVTVVLTLCVSGAAQVLQAQQSEDEPRNPGRGVRVIEVIPGTQAERAGIQRMDLLSKYGTFTVVDHSTYYIAREAYLKNPKVKVPVEFWRGHIRIIVHVFPGRLGIDTNEYGSVAYQFHSAMMHIDAIKGLPHYMRAVEFKEEFDKGGVAAGVAKGREIIDRAEADGTLTATQILVARINLILDDAPAEELKRQDVLLAEFMRNQPSEYIGYLGEHLMEKGHYRPARTLLKQYLLTDPDNISVRQNLGYASLMLGMWDDAEAAADFVLTDPHGRNEHELQIAYQQKALGALNRRDYNTSMTFAEKGLALSGGGFELRIIQLVAALTGNVEKFRNAVRTSEGDLPKKSETYDLQRDSAEALALVLSGHIEPARVIVARWSQKDRVEGRLKDYWRNFPGADKVIENWLRLATPQN